MTGTAATLRKVKPEPLKPALGTGSFEDEMTKDGPLDIPKGWYYVRQAEVVVDEKAPDGRRYMRFVNAEPGRLSQMLQGFPLDGSKINNLELSLRAKGAN